MYHKNESIFHLRRRAGTSSLVTLLVLLATIDFKVGASDAIKIWLNNFDISEISSNRSQSVLTNFARQSQSGKFVTNFDSKS